MASKFETPQQRAILGHIADMLKDVINQGTDGASLKDAEDCLVEMFGEVGRRTLESVAADACQREGSRLDCDCGCQQRFVSDRGRVVQTCFGPIDVKRPYFRCLDACGEAQHLGDDFLFTRYAGWSDRLLETVILVATLIPSFAQASEMLARLLRVDVEAKQIERLSAFVGGEAVAARDDEAREQWGVGQRQVDEVPKRGVIQVDGSMINTREGWREAKLAVLYDQEKIVSAGKETRVETATDTKKERRRSLQGAAYVGHVGSAEKFEELLNRQIISGGFLESPELCFMGDGAPWIWNIADMLVPQATQILDWYHVKDHVRDCSNAMWKTGSEKAVAWRKKTLDLLWNGHVDKLLSELETLVFLDKERTDAKDGLKNYLGNNRTRIDYPRYRAHGWDIGTGAIESSNKRVVGGRLKATGQRWSRSSAEAMLRLRTIYFSGHWDMLWAA